MAAPTTSLLDDFNRADANPLNGNWAAFSAFAANPLKLLTNRVVGSAGGTNASYYTVSCGPDCEVYDTVLGLETVDGQPHETLFLRVANPTSGGTYNAYRLIINFRSGGTLDEWFITKIVAGSSTTIAGPVSNDIAINDKIWFNATGSLLTGYQQVGGAGSWNQIIQVTDSAVTAAGFLALALRSVNVNAADDFSGGTATSTDVSLPAWPRIRFNG